MKLKKFRPRLTLFALLLTTSSWVFGQEIPPELLQQKNQPTVEQMENLLQQWKEQGLELKLESHPELFSIVEREVAKELHFDYPKWFSLIHDDAARMLASFERAYPGATFVFIGRDMTVFADLFESYFRKLEQPERVKRLGMSTATLDNLDKDLSLGLLKSHNIDYENTKYPIVFVDAISKNGGRQARRLLNSLYQYYQQKNVRAGDAFLKANLIGMRVATTQLDYTPLEQSVEAFREWQKFSTYDSDVFSFNVKFMMFKGINRGGKYLNSTEAGYVHWIGAWQGSYGTVASNSKGQVFATPGDLLQDPLRENFLKYSIKIVEYGKTEEFDQLVKKEAQKLGYSFPTTRPDFIADPTGEFSSRIANATDWNFIKDEIQKIPVYNMGRLELGDFASSLVKQVKNKSWPMNDEIRAEMEKVLPGLADDIGWKKILLRSTEDHAVYVKRFKDLVKKLKQAKDQSALEKNLNDLREEAKKHFTEVGEYGDFRRIYIENFSTGDANALVLVNELLQEESSFTKKLAIVEKYKTFFDGKVDGMLESFKGEIRENFKKDTEWQSLVTSLVGLKASDAFLLELYNERVVAAQGFEKFSREAMQMQQLLGNRSNLINDLVEKTTFKYYETEHPEPKLIREFVRSMGSSRKDRFLNKAIEISLLRRDDLDVLADMLPNFLMRSEEQKRVIGIFKERTKNDSFWNRFMRGEIGEQAPSQNGTAGESGNSGQDMNSNSDVVSGRSCTRSLNQD